MSKSPTTLISQPPDLQVHEADDGLIVFDPANDKVHHLNSSAGVLFSLCDTPQTSDELIQSFLTAYSLDHNARDDVQQALDQLLGEGVLTATPAS